MPTLADCFVYPVKSLAPASVASSGLQGGALDHDREYAVVDADGDPVNGKRTAAVHRLRSSFDPDGPTLTVRRVDDDPADARRFHLDDERDALAAWLTDYFDLNCRVVREPDGGLPDDTTASGPTVVSTGTLETVAGWFDGVTATECRRRFRPNLVVDAPAFWEDRLYADSEHVVAFDVGETTLSGVNPCQRCVVPTRDPDTGAVTPDFRERFVRKRETTLPDWSRGERFDHAYRLTVNTYVPADERDGTVSVGDAVAIREERPSPLA